VRFRGFGGDNRDLGKGFVFHHLAGLLRDFRVDPMVTDEDLPPGPGRRAFVEAYRRFLRLADGDRVVNGDVDYRGGGTVLRGGREEPYFGPHVGHDGDLFLDPDTGVGGRGSGYVPCGVIGQLLPAGAERVLLVNVSADRKDATWRRLLGRVPRWADGRLQAFVCDLGGNGILFLANKGNGRMKFMRGTLKNVFGPVAEWRVISG
jgi:hypothetical protein